MEINEELSQELIRRATTILEKITDFTCNPDVLAKGPILEIAEKLKIYVDMKNCVIKSWVRGGRGYSLCYNYEKYDANDKSTWEVLIAPSESESVIAAFMWLYDRQNFIPESIKTIREEI